MQILDGKKLSIKILENLKEKVKLETKKPCLAVILLNNTEASRIYVSKKEKTARELGYNSFVYKFDENITQNEVIELIKKLNNDENIHAILIQLPIFPHLKESELIETIDPKKDVDGFHPVNVGKLNIGLKPYATPCTPKGIIKILKEYDIELSGKDTIVIGRSNIVGKPIAALLLKENATVTVAHSKTKNLSDLTKTKDIIISATGNPLTVTKEMVKQDTVLVDVGISKKDGKLVGDIDFENVKEKAKAITPVPGGVGPMTVAMLMENTYELFLQTKGS